MGKRWKKMYKRWVALCMVLLTWWVALPVAQAESVQGTGGSTGNTTIGIESVGSASPTEWYEFTVTVQDEAGNLLEGVVVCLYPVLWDGSLGAAITGANGQYMTDSNGQQRFQIPPPGGAYQIRTVLVGFEDYVSQYIQITGDGSKTITLKKLPSSLPNGGENQENSSHTPPKTGDGFHWHWYILLCMAVSMIVAMGRLWYLSRLRREYAAQAAELEEMGVKK